MRRFHVTSDSEKDDAIIVRIHGTAAQQFRDRQQEFLTMQVIICFWDIVNLGSPLTLIRVPSESYTSYATTVNFTRLDLFRTLPVSFLAQALNLYSRLLYFVQYDKDPCFLQPEGFGLPRNVTFGVYPDFGNGHRQKDTGGRLNKKDGLTRYGDPHVKDKTS